MEDTWIPTCGVLVRFLDVNTGWRRCAGFRRLRRLPKCGMMRNTHSGLTSHSSTGEAPPLGCTLRALYAVGLGRCHERHAPQAEPIIRCCRYRDDILGGPSPEARVLA